MVEVTTPCACNSRKERIAPTLICLAAVCSIAVALLVRMNFKAFPEVDISQMERDDATVQYYIDTANFDGGYLVVTGWAVDLEEPLSTVQCTVALRAVSNGIPREMKTAMQYREGLSTALGTEGMDNGGFQAKVDVDKLKATETYQLLLLYRNNGKNCLVETNVWINGQGERLDGNA